MANVDITIPTPILMPGEYFKVRYRPYPAGSYTTAPNQTNAPFTITGLTANQQYEFEITLVKADASECTPVYIYRTPREFECIDFTVIQEGNGADIPYRLKITYTDPAPDPNTYCKVYVRNKRVSDTGWTAPSFTTLPASPFYVNLLLPIEDRDVQIYFDTCSGQYAMCFDDTVPKPEEPPCEGMTASLQNIQFNGYNIDGSLRIALTIQGTQSTPRSTNINFYITQRNINITPPFIPTNATFNNTPPAAAGQPFNLGWGVTAAPSKDQKYYFDINFTDRCGNHFSIPAFIQLT